MIQSLEVETFPVQLETPLKLLAGLLVSLEISRLPVLQLWELFMLIKVQEPKKVQITAKAQGQKKVQYTIRSKRVKDMSDFFRLKRYKDRKRYKYRQRYKDRKR